MTGRLATLILAGGKGERLGGAMKANVTVGGVRLLERVSAALGAADVALISVGGFDPAELGLLAGQVGVADLATDYAGPLAGVAAAIDWCNRAAEQPALLLTAAVDTPFLPADFAAKMLAALPEGAPAIIASYDGQDYPTNALWRLNALRDLPARVVAGTAPHSLRRLAAEVGAVTFDWPESPDGDPFANVNTPADLAALEARAARGK